MTGESGGRRGRGVTVRAGKLWRYASGQRAQKLVEPIPAIVNLASGSAPAAVAVLRDEARVRVLECTPARLSDRVAEHVKQGAERVLVAGGDGTLSTAARALLGQPTALGVIPAGTLNHFARSMAIPLDPKAALDAALGGVRTPVNVGCVNDLVILNTSSVGAYVGFVRRRERWERWLGYYGASAVAILQSYYRLPELDIDVEMNDQSRRCQSPFVFIGVDERDFCFPQLGERKPAGRQGLHVVVLCRTTGILPMAVRSLLNGLPWDNQDDVESMIVPSCRIALPSRRASIAVDGELVRIHGELHYSYRAEALTVVTPKSGAAT